MFHLWLVRSTWRSWILFEACKVKKLASPYSHVECNQENIHNLLRTLEKTSTCTSLQFCSRVKDKYIIFVEPLNAFKKTACAQFEKFSSALLNLLLLKQFQFSHPYLLFWQILLCLSVNDMIIPRDDSNSITFQATPCNIV